MKSISNISFRVELRKSLAPFMAVAINPFEVQDYCSSDHMQTARLALMSVNSTTTDFEFNSPSIFH